jgi:hypothetical protein
MIIQAIHNTINPIITAYAMLGDIEAVVPFAIYSIDQRPMYDKEGITAYENTVDVSVVDITASRCATKSGLVVAALLGLEGTVVDTTAFDIARLNRQTMRFDDKAQAYINYIQVRLITQNE